MDVFNKIAFTVFDQGVSWGELVGDVTGLLCVWWLVRQIIWNWPMGLVNNIFFFILFASSHLYANAVLQVVFFVLGIYGWWQWSIGCREPIQAERVELPVRRTTRNEWIVIALAIAVVWPAAWAFLVRFTDPAAPMWDSLTLALSLVATVAQAKKLIESWWIYIVVDAISVPLFISQELALTAVLFTVFGVMCAFGLRDWTRSLKSAEPVIALGDMSASTEHGLVIGKFYPPHAGHHLLIRSAAAVSGRVTVLVMASSAESIPLDRRTAWLAEAHADEANVTIHGVIDDHPIDYADPGVWDLHMAVIADGLRAVTSCPVTAVFSSEPYGSEMARRLGAVDVVVDVDRTLEPISATAVRADLVGSWEHLAEPTRGGLAMPVVVIGAESTGKTTLSRALTDALRRRGGAHGLTRWVPEFGRPYTIDKFGVARAAAGVAGAAMPTMNDLVWTSDEFEVIAKVQNQLEDRESRIGGPVLMCDTDAFATAIWHERYLGVRSPSVDALARHHPLYLLTHHDDVPFAQDGIRDGEAIRSWMTDRFVEELAESGRRTVVLRGSHEERLADGLAAIDKVLAVGLDAHRWSTR